MSRPSISGFHFSLLPPIAILKILTELFKDERDTPLQHNIANIGSVRMINMFIEADNSKVNIVDFMDTRLWLKLLISTGIFDIQPHKEWGDTIKEYLGRIVIERRYTSRVHDLIDIYKHDSSLSIRDYAQSLLNNLITRGSSAPERKFLRGEMTDIPRLNNTTIRELVRNNEQFKIIRYWDVRNVTDMSSLFYDRYNVRNSKLGLDLTYWDTKNVTDMSELMRSVFINIRGITNWNTCRVKNMDCCFMNAELFNYPIEWNTSNVQKMNAMFFNAKLFNKSLHFDTSNVHYMNSMFHSATSFNQPLYWDTRKVSDMRNMFNGAISFNQPLEWNIRSDVYVNGMFDGATSFNQPLFILRINRAIAVQKANAPLVWTGSWGGYQPWKPSPWNPNGGFPYG
jgi:surface protein